MKLRFLLIIGGLFLHAPPGMSQSLIDDPKKLQTFFASDVYRGLIRNATARTSKSYVRECQQLKNGDQKVVIMKPIVFGSESNPQSGEWKQSLEMVGCGDPIILNYEFSVDAEKKIRTIILFPGTTIATSLLQRDTVMYANMGARGQSKDCPEFTITNTRFDRFIESAPASPGATQRPWSETWTLVGCGRTFDVPIEYLPNNRGTVITQRGKVTER